jgi:hypothetical protein
MNSQARNIKEDRTVRNLVLLIAAGLFLALASVGPVLADPPATNDVPRTGTDCGPQGADYAKQWFEISADNGIHINKIQSYNDASCSKSDILASISLTLKTTITVTKLTGHVQTRVPTKTVVITVLKNDYVLTTCDDLQEPRESYWASGGYFNFIEKTDDQDFPTVLTKLMSTDLQKSKVSIYFDPTDMRNSWYQLKIEPLDPEKH